MSISFQITPTGLQLGSVDAVDRREHSMSWNDPPISNIHGDRAVTVFGPSHILYGLIAHYVVLSPSLDQSLESYLAHATTLILETKSSSYISLFLSKTHCSNSIYRVGLE